MITLTVNGESRSIKASPDTPLLYVLRDELGLNAAKYGCGLGQCGACTVIVDGKAIFSCITPVRTRQDRCSAPSLPSRRHNAAIVFPA